MKFKMGEREIIFDLIPPPPSPDKTLEPMRVELSVNDKDPKAPPPPPPPKNK